jgi:YHS domain-containing protein
MPLRTTLLTALLTAGLSALPLHAARDPGQAADTAGEEALSGLDPVLLAQGKEVDGVEAHAVTHQGLVYYFASAESKATFVRDPSRYGVQLDGMCARMGPPVTGSQGIYAVHEGHIYVFGTEECRKIFLSAPGRFTDKAPSLMPEATSERSRRAGALLDKAVAAMGGAAVDRVTTYRERSRTLVATRNGDVTITNTLTVAPAGWRRDSSSSFGEGSVVVTGTEAFSVGRGQAPRPLPAASRAALDEGLARTPLHLLRARSQPGFQALALDAAPAAGIAEVAVSFERHVSVIAIDEQSGRIVSARFRSRSPQSGEFGEIVQRFSDFRAAGPLSLPFKIDGQFDGETVSRLGRLVETFEVDIPVDAVMFAKPSP